MSYRWIASSLLSIIAATQAREKHAGCFYGATMYPWSAAQRPGMGQFWPEDIDTSLCDVIYYGFGTLLNETYEVCSWDPVFDLGPDDKGDTTIQNCVGQDPGMGGEQDGIRRTIALKEKKPGLKILFSVGSWKAGGWVFSQMVKTRESRTRFESSVTHFLKYFGFDGLDIDWQFPALDMWTMKPTDPEDKTRFTALAQELKTAFAGDDLLLTVSVAADPAKADNAYELDKLPDYVDWFNVLSFDYSGSWDGFTGIDEPLYGKWDESFPGHEHFQFNVHETIQFYLQRGVNPNQLSLGIHSEGKSYLLTDTAKEAPGVYCPAAQAPELPFSRQENWLTYYELLQLFYNDTIQYPGWDGLEPGLDHWTVYDHGHGNVDMCYMAPYAYQGPYWVSYEDPMSVDVKARYANHYGLKGAFIFTVQSDDFIGLFGQNKFGLLSAMNAALESETGLTDEEIHGAASENTNCAPDYPTCRERVHPTADTNSGVLVANLAWANAIIILSFYF